MVYLMLFFLQPFVRHLPWKQPLNHQQFRRVKFAPGSHLANPVIARMTFGGMASLACPGPSALASMATCRKFEYYDNVGEYLGSEYSWTWSV